jgi:hypothetical protein
MERQSNLHSPRVDDELEHEVSSLTHGAPVEARVEESRLMEDAGDGEPIAQAIIGELHDAEGGDEIAGGLSRSEVTARSELAIHLRPGIFPAGRDAIIECAEEEHAPTELLGQLRALPHGSYENVQQVWEALGGKREEGSGHVVQDDPHVREDAEAPQRSVAEPVVSPRPAPSQRFAFRFDRWHRLAALPFGVSPSSAHVEVVTEDGGERMLTARFGPWSVTTPVANVAGTATSGPYALAKTAGPAHVSLKDFGLTFATNGARGLCIRFRRAVPGLEPTGLVRHPALTVTVDDPDGLARVLAV